MNMEHYEKLATLFDFPHAVDMLLELTEIGIIAGGSIVWCLKDAETSDIDLFVKEDIKSQIWKIIKRYTDITDSTKTNISHSVYLKGGKIPIQVIIRKEAESVDSLLSAFDMDYCRCALYKSEFFITDECKEAHETMVCKTASLSSNRNIKAVEKGFKIPYCVFVSSDSLGWSNSNVSMMEDESFEVMSQNPKAYLFEGRKNFSDPKFVRFFDDGVNGSGAAVYIRNNRYVYDPYKKDPRLDGDVEGHHIGIKLQRTCFNGKLESERCYSFPITLKVIGCKDNVIIYERELSNPFHTNFKIIKGDELDIEKYFDRELVYSAEIVKSKDKAYLILRWVFNNGDAYWYPSLEEGMFVDINNTKLLPFSFN